MTVNLHRVLVIIVVICIVVIFLIIFAVQSSSSPSKFSIQAHPPYPKTSAQRLLLTVKVLTECASCGEEKYIAEGQTTCEERRSKRKRKVKA
jgi:hypothetical protein